MNTIQVYSTNPTKMARLLARLAVRALYFEVRAHPKPGLVSFVCNGAHQDMNGALFYRSLFSLRHYFYQLVLQDTITPQFDVLKGLAIKAEERMLMATKGVNTHRGALFALGILCISTARLSAIKRDFTPLDLHHQIIHDWQETLATHTLNKDSHGSEVYKKYKVIGAKQMAMQGYEIVFRILDSFIELFEQVNSLDVACLYAYAAFLQDIDDTNILYRKDIAGLNFAKQQAKKILRIDCIEERRLFALTVHRDFLNHRLSPGGVGDLLSVLIFISQLFSDKFVILNAAIRESMNDN